MRIAENAATIANRFQTGYSGLDAMSCSDRPTVCYDSTVAFQGNPNVHDQESQ